MDNMKKITFLAFALMVAVTPAFADTLFVPFFRDGFEAGQNQGFISITNTSTTTDTTISVVYTAADAINGPQAAGTFRLNAGVSVGWRPVAVDGAGEGGGGSVPDMTVHVNFPVETAAGSAIISSNPATKLVGRYLERNLVTGVTAMYVIPN